MGLSHISSQVTGHWGELCNRTGEVHPVDPFHSLDILKNNFASVDFCRNSGVYNVQNGAVIELSFVVVVCHDQVRLQVSQGFRCRDS